MKEEKSVKDAWLMLQLSAGGTYVLYTSEGTEPSSCRGVINACIHWVKDASGLVGQLWVHFQVTLEKEEMCGVSWKKMLLMQRDSLLSIAAAAADGGWGDGWTQEHLDTSSDVIQ